MIRIDQLIVEKNLAPTRTKAQGMIESGEVFLEGETVKKASLKVSREVNIEVLEKKRYVSRSALKLKHYIDTAGLNVIGRECLDVGASTGGFTEVLLEAGAALVVALDVGKGQLHPSLKESERVISLEEMDIRDYEPQKPFSLVTCDASFIALKHIIPAIHQCASHEIVLLFKPQFEVGKEVKRDRKGVVMDATAIENALLNLLVLTERLNWKLQAKTLAHITGKEGNQEYVLHFFKG